MKVKKKFSLVVWNEHLQKMEKVLFRLLAMIKVQKKNNNNKMQEVSSNCFKHLMFRF